MSELVYNWYNVTTLADRDWRAALAHYWNERGHHRGALWAPNTDWRQARVEAQIAVARCDYRGRVLTWYWTLCLPLALGSGTPNSVAELLAEEWDISTDSAHPMHAHGRFFEYLKRPLGGA